MLMSFESSYFGKGAEIAPSRTTSQPLCMQWLLNAVLRLSDGAPGKHRALRRILALTNFVDRRRPVQRWELDCELAASPAPSYGAIVTVPKGGCANSKRCFTVPKNRRSARAAANSGLAFDFPAPTQ